MSSENAYNYIPNVVEVLLNLNHEYLLWETLYFLIELYRIADTTHIHPYLETKWTLLEEHIKNYEDVYDTPFNELERHIRIKD